MESGFTPCGCHDGYLLDPVSEWLVKVCPNCGGEGIVSVDALIFPMIEEIYRAEEAA